MQLISVASIGSGRAKKTAIRPLVSTLEEVKKAVSASLLSALSALKTADKTFKNGPKKPDYGQSNGGQKAAKSLTASIYVTNTLTKGDTTADADTPPSPQPDPKDGGQKQGDPEQLEFEFIVTEALSGIVSATRNAPTTMEGYGMKITEVMLGLKEAQNSKRASLRNLSVPAAVKTRTEFYTLYRQLMKLELGVVVNATIAKQVLGQITAIQATLADYPEITPHALLSAVLTNWSSVRADLKTAGQDWKVGPTPDLWVLSRHIGLIVTWYRARQEALQAMPPVSAPTPPAKAATPATPQPVAPPKVFGPHPGMDDDTSTHQFDAIRAEVFAGSYERTLAHWAKKGWPVPSKYAAEAMA